MILIVWSLTCRRLIGFSLFTRCRFRYLNSGVASWKLEGLWSVALEFYFLIIIITILILRVKVRPIDTLWHARMKTFRSAGSLSLFRRFAGKAALKSKKMGIAENRPKYIRNSAHTCPLPRPELSNCRGTSSAYVPAPANLRSISILDFLTPNGRFSLISTHTPERRARFYSFFIFFFHFPFSSVYTPPCAITDPSFAFSLATLHSLITRRISSGFFLFLLPSHSVWYFYLTLNGESVSNVLSRFLSAWTFSSKQPVAVKVDPSRGSVRNPTTDFQRHQPIIEGFSFIAPTGLFPQAFERFHGSLSGPVSTEIYTYTHRRPITSRLPHNWATFFGL